MHCLPAISFIFKNWDTAIRRSTRQNKAVVMRSPRNAIHRWLMEFVLVNYAPYVWSRLPMNYYTRIRGRVILLTWVLRSDNKFDEIQKNNAKHRFLPAIIRARRQKGAELWVSPSNLPDRTFMTCKCRRVPESITSSIENLYWSIWWTRRQTLRIIVKLRIMDHVIMLSVDWN